MSDPIGAGVYLISGQGSYVIPEYWVPRFAKALDTAACWGQFVMGDIDGAKLLAAGQGDTIHCNYFGNIGIPAADLTEGTYVGNGTQSAYQTNLTVYEFGQKIVTSGHELWMVGQGLDSKAMDSVIINSIQTWEDRIGAAAIAATYNFDCRAADSTVYSASAGGTVGTAYLLPSNLRAMAAEFGRNRVPSWRQYGKPYSWVCVMPFGGFSALEGQTEFQTVASMQNPEYYPTGAIGVYHDVLCVHETGVGKTSHSTTTGTGVFMGPALIGDTTLGGAASNTYAMWSDSLDHPGRTSYFGWYGHYAVGLVPAVGTVVRAATVHCKME